MTIKYLYTSFRNSSSRTKKRPNSHKNEQFGDSNEVPACYVWTHMC